MTNEIEGNGNPVGTTYVVTIAETLNYLVEVEAASRDEAIQVAYEDVAEHPRADATTGFSVVDVREVGE